WWKVGSVTAPDAFESSTSGATAVLMLYRVPLESFSVMGSAVATDALPRSARTPSRRRLLRKPRIMTPSHRWSSKRSQAYQTARHRTTTRIDGRGCCIATMRLLCVAYRLARAIHRSVTPRRAARGLRLRGVPSRPGEAHHHRARRSGLHRRHADGRRQVAGVPDPGAHPAGHGPRGEPADLAHEGSGRCARARGVPRHAAQLDSRR